MTEHKIIEQKKNQLLNREEIKLIMYLEKNPSFDLARKLISEITKTAEENIAVKSIKGKFGRKSFLITANVYNTKEDKEKIEPKPKPKMKKAEEEKKEVEKAEKEEKKEKKPEEKTIEKKEEKKQLEEKEQRRENR